jgi:hypothetical protein
VKTVAKIIVASAFCFSVGAPAFAQSAKYDHRTGQQMIHRQSVDGKRARNAFAMESKFGIESNSPAATGGGSIGYNRKLLED